MERNGYNYKAIVPSELITVGYLKYQIIVKNDKETRTYPADAKGMPFDWDFYDRSTYEVRVVPAENSITLFNAKTDADLLVKEWRNTIKLVPTNNENEDAYLINIEKLFVPDNENLNAPPIYDYSFKHFILDKINGRLSDFSSKETIVFKGASLNNKPCKLQIAFVMNDGAAFGNVIEIGTETKEYHLLIKELKPVKTVTLPRPYPSFLPYYLNHNLNSKFDINKIESIQFSIGPEILNNDLEEKHGVSIISVSLE